MALKSYEHIINHHGVYYIGTISDYLRICRTDNYLPPPEVHPYEFDRDFVRLPIATKDDIEEYAVRCMKMNDETKNESEN